MDALHNSGHDKRYVMPHAEKDRWRRMTMLFTMCLSVFVERVPPSHGCCLGRYFGMLASFFSDLSLFCLISRSARPATLTNESRPNWEGIVTFFCSRRNSTDLPELFTRVVSLVAVQKYKRRYFSVSSQYGAMYGESNAPSTLPAHKRCSTLLYVRSHRYFNAHTPRVNS